MTFPFDFFRKRAANESKTNKGEDPFIKTPKEIWEIIFKFLLSTPSIALIKNMTTLRLVHKGFKNLCDDIFNDPKNIISLMVNEQSAEQCFHFLKRFRSTMLFQQLSNSDAQQDPIGFICHALACEYPLNINLDHLVKAIFSAKDCFNSGDFDYLKLITHIQEANSDTSDSRSSAAKTFFVRTRSPFLFARFFINSAHDLTKLQLPYTDFSYLNLIGTDFEKANLAHCKFKGTELEKTNFCDADLTNTLFSDLPYCAIRITPWNCTCSEEGDAEIKTRLDDLYRFFNENLDPTFSFAVALGFIGLFDHFPFKNVHRVLDNILLTHDFFPHPNSSFWSRFFSPSPKTAFELLTEFKQRIIEQEKSFYKDMMPHYRGFVG